MFWYPPKKQYVRVNPRLVDAADSSLGNWGDGLQVDSQEFIIASGNSLALLAGLLGLGLGYLLANARRLPSPGESVRVVPWGEPTYTGPWGGVSGDGRVHVGKKEFDSDHLRFAGPVKPFQGGGEYIDLRSGFADPDELAKLIKAHNRNGFHRRKGRR
jgi:hypothetical protein